MVIKIRDASQFPFLARNDEFEAFREGTEMLIVEGQDGGRTTLHSTGGNNGIVNAPSANSLLFRAMKKTSVGRPI